MPPGPRSADLRIVLDTNVLVSALHFGGRPRRVLQGVLRGQHELVVGRFLLEELTSTLREVCGWDEGAIAAVRSDLEALAEIVESEVIPAVCRDPDDNQILAIGEAGVAAAIVTGDSDLLTLGEFRGIRILSVAGFEELVAKA